MAHRKSAHRIEKARRIARYRQLAASSADASTRKLSWNTLADLEAALDRKSVV